MSLAKSCLTFLVEQFLRKVRPRRRPGELNLKTFYHQNVYHFPGAADVCSSSYELTLLFFYFLLWTPCYSVSISTARFARVGAGGEAQSKHKEGFDPLKCSLCLKRNWPSAVWSRPVASHRGLGAEVTLSF
jgi:hypothetical protein